MATQGAAPLGTAPYVEVSYLEAPHLEETHLEAPHLVQPPFSSPPPLPLSSRRQCPSRRRPVIAAFTTVAPPAPVATYNQAGASGPGDQARGVGLDDQAGAAGPDNQALRDLRGDDA